MRVIRRHTTGAKDESCFWVVFGIEPLVLDASVYSGTHQPARHVSSSSFLAVWSSNSVSSIDGMGRRRKFVVAVLRLALAPFSITSSLDNSSFLAGSSCRCSHCRCIIAEDEDIISGEQG